MDRMKHSPSFKSLRFIFVLQTFLYHQVSSDHPFTRQVLEIGLGPSISIGIGTNSPPDNPYDSPPPPATSPGYSNCAPPPPPPVPVFPFESKRVEIVYPVIQNFKKKITHDPFGITQTWVGPDICNKYKGFFCATVPDYNVTALAGVDFNGYRFAGPELTLTGFIDSLPDIAVFHANSNFFTGAIPKNVAKLRYLYELDLSNNIFRGEFPKEVFAATNLTFLDLRFNSFSGLLPAQVFFQDLDVLFINNNNFVQSLPSNLGSSPVLYLTLANNNFTGPIPSSIGEASDSLVEVVLLNNQLSGCLPCEVGLLGNVTLFDASQNMLTGPIPQSFGCLGNIEVLNLAQNQLYGPVPEALCWLPKLGNLSLSYNYFTSVGPMCKKLIIQKVLDVRMNCIIGLPAQRSAADCAAFFSKPKFCSEKKASSWIPCGKYINSNKQQPSDRVAAAHAPRSYGALKPNRL